MTDSLTLQLARTGLIQFGRFEQPDGSFWPVTIDLRWLPSYPAVLSAAAATLEPIIRAQAVDRVLTTTGALPVGVALGLQTDLPLAYVVGDVRDYTAAFAIEGAYDVGHPTVLLLDVLVDAGQAEAVTATAKRVGLNVSTIVAVVDLGLGARAALEAAGLGVQTILTLRAMLPELSAVGWLPPVMRVTVEEWMNQYGA